MNFLSHQVCDVKITVLRRAGAPPAALTYVTSQPLLSASSRQVLVDLKMRRCSLKRRNGMTSIGVDSSKVSSTARGSPTSEPAACAAASAAVATVAVSASSISYSGGNGFGGS